MRLDLTPAGLVDDFAIDNAEIEIRRAGVSRYAIAVRSPDYVASFILWTTEKASIELTVNQAASDQSWCSLQSSATVLESLVAAPCQVHLEQMDRKSYFLGLSRESDAVLLLLSAPGYVKAKPTAAT